MPIFRDDQTRAKKILSLRLFDNANGKPWDKSVADLGLEILCVSQVRESEGCVMSDPLLWSEDV